MPCYGINLNVCKNVFGKKQNVVEVTCCNVTMERKHLKKKT